MEIREAIEIIKKLTKELNENENVKQANDMAIKALEKQIPTKPIKEKWSPALCPNCGESLSKSLGDGYYKHYDGIIICNCGQKLDWY
jgi:hypothetical protein